MTFIVITACVHAIEYIEEPKVEILSTHEAVVWWEFHQGLPTAEIASKYERSRKPPESLVKHLMEKKCNESDLDYEVRVKQIQDRFKDKFQFKDTPYVSRVLNRAREKIVKALKKLAKTHRLDEVRVQDYNGLLVSFDYQANAKVYMVFTLKLGVIVWYKHDSYAGRLCPECPKEGECREILDIVAREYNIALRPDELDLYMTEQSTAIFEKLTEKEILRYKRSDS